MSSQKLNLQEATREELIRVVRTLNSRLEALKQHPPQAKDDVHQLRLVQKELEDRVASMAQQIALLKDELLEKECEARATREQVIMLTERAATDEALIDELRRAPRPAADKQSMPSVSEIACAPPSAPSPSSTPAALRELEELLTAVAQQQRDDKNNASALRDGAVESATGPTGSSASIGGVSAMHALRRELDECRRATHVLQDELNQKELETTRMVRWIASKHDLWEVDRKAEQQQQQQQQQQRGMHESHSAGNMAALSETGSSRNGTDESASVVQQRSRRTQMATLVHSSSSRAVAALLDGGGGGAGGGAPLEPLPALRGMTPREKRLAERIALLEQLLHSLEAQASRERSGFAELEKHRSELLMSANQALDAHVKEIQALKKTAKATSREGQSTEQHRSEHTQTTAVELPTEQQQHAAAHAAAQAQVEKASLLHQIAALTKAQEDCQRSCAEKDTQLSAVHRQLQEKSARVAHLEQQRHVVCRAPPQGPSEALQGDLPAQLAVRNAEELQRLDACLAAHGRASSSSSAAPPLDAAVPFAPAVHHSPAPEDLFSFFAAPVAAPPQAPSTAYAAVGFNPFD